MPPKSETLRECQRREDPQSRRHYAGIVDRSTRTPDNWTRSKRPHTGRTDHHAGTIDGAGTEPRRADPPGRDNQTSRADPLGRDAAGIRTDADRSKKRRNHRAVKATTQGRPRPGHTAHPIPNTSREDITPGHAAKAAARDPIILEANRQRTPAKDTGRHSYI